MPQTKTGPYQLFMLVLCVAVLGALTLEATWDLHAGSRQILLWFDLVASLVFMGDFFLSLRRAQDRKQYMLTWGWIDFLSSIPSVAVLRWGRAARIARIFRLLRGVRSIRMLGGVLLDQRRKGTGLATILVFGLSLFFGSIAILQVEAPMGGNIQTAGDALWWTLVTMSTAGFGDYYPITPEGRVVGGTLMIVGIGIYAALTGLVASWLVAPQEERAHDELHAEIVALRKTLEQRTGPVAGLDSDSTRDSTG